jgi:hypothetical protein
VQLESDKALKEHKLLHLSGGLQEVDSAFQRRFRTVRVPADVSMHKTDLLKFFHEHRKTIKEHLKKEWKRLGGIRFYVSIKTSMKRLKPDEVVQEVMPVFSSYNEQAVNLSDLENSVTLCEEEIIDRIDKYTERGSGFHLCRIIHLDVGTVAYNPLAASSYMELPVFVQRKKACVNVQNFTDDLCFVWSVMCSLFPASQSKNRQRVTAYRPHYNEKTGLANIPERPDLVLDFGGLSFPASLKDIDKFESNNPTIGVNVLTFDDSMGTRDDELDGGLPINDDDDEENDEEEEQEQEEKKGPRPKVVPLRMAKNQKTQHVVTLLMLSNSRTRHYACVVNLNRLLNEANRSYQWCVKCLQRFAHDFDLDEDHADTCGLFAPQRVVMPKSGEVITFKAAHKTMPKSHVVYADLEATLVPLKNENRGERTNLLERHKANTFCMYMVGEQKSVGPITYVGEDAMVKFALELEKLSAMIQRQRLSRVAVPLTDADFHVLDRRVCSVCAKNIGALEPVHRHHDHQTGEALGFTHVHCNLNAWARNGVPVVMHNGTKYDLHLFLRELSKRCARMYVIPDNMENYKTLSWTFKCDQCRGRSCKHYATMQLLDSYQFVQCSLSKWVEVSKNSAYFQHLGRWADANHPEKDKTKVMQLLKGKNIYPYSYVDSIDKLHQTTALPPIECFESSLTKELPDLEEYRKAQEAWDFFQCKTLEDYHLLYVKCDVLLLADCMEHFRHVCHSTMQLDPLHYLGLPGFAWDCMLRFLSVELPLIDDCTMYNFFESAIRGGVSQVGLRFARANNPLLASYDATLPTSHIMYLDATNLYGAAMTRPLPMGDYQWLDEDWLAYMHERLVEHQDHQALVDDHYGFALEVDLHYPHHLHDDHSDFPLAPENVVPPADWLSPASKKLANDMNLPKPTCSKLIPHLNDREHYRVHWTALQTYMKYGMVVTKVHKGVLYKHQPWLKDYIRMNTKARQKAQDDVTSKFHKDMNNIIYGKMVEGVRNRVCVKLRSSWKAAKKLVNKPTYKHHKIIDENLVLVQMQQTQVTLNKLPAVGSAILDAAKSIMYEFYYGKLRKAFDRHEARLVMTDTDSFLLHITSEDMWYKWATMMESLDVSSYGDDHPLFEIEGCLKAKHDNKKKLGTFKDEMGGHNVIREAVALRSKMYSLMVENKNDIKRCKGISRHTVEKILSHQDYVNCLRGNPTVRVTTAKITNLNHELFTSRQEKLALSAYDDKRYVLDDLADTLAHGHAQFRDVSDVGKELEILVQESLSCLEFDTDDGEANTT